MHCRKMATLFHQRLEKRCKGSGKGFTNNRLSPLHCSTIPIILRLCQKSDYVISEHFLDPFEVRQACRDDRIDRVSPAELLLRGWSSTSAPYPRKTKTLFICIHVSRLTLCFHNRMKSRVPHASFTHSLCFMIIIMAAISSVQ